MGPLERTKPMFIMASEYSRAHTEEDPPVAGENDEVVIIQNIPLRVYMSLLQGMCIVGSILALFSQAYETAKCLIGVNFALGFLGIFLFRYKVDLTQIYTPIMSLIGFSVLGVVAGANGSNIGLYMALCSLIALIATVLIFVHMT